MILARVLIYCRVLAVAGAYVRRGRSMVSGELGRSPAAAAIRRLGAVRAVELAGEERAQVLVGGCVVEVVVHCIEPWPSHPGKVVINYRDRAGVPGAVVVDGQALIVVRPAPGLCERS